MNYYEISGTPQNISAPDKVILANPQRYFILRNGDSAYHMSDIINDGSLFACKLETLPPEHRLHLTRGINGNMRFKKYKADSVVLNEAHIYIQPDAMASNGTRYILNPDKVQNIEVLAKDKHRTRTSYWIGGTAITVGLLMPIIIIATGSLVTMGP